MCLRSTPLRHQNAEPPAEIRPLEADRVPAAANFNWRQVESADYRVYVANLRAIGCPEETIRDIVIADVTKLFAVRKKALLDFGPTKYWLPAQPEAAKLARWRREQNDSLDSERRQLLASLLGPKAEEDLARTESSDPNEALEFLPSEKRLAILRMESSFKTERQKVYAEAEEYSSAPDRQRLKNLHDQRELELKQLLSPDEVFEYQLRTDDVAERLRLGMVGFEPTESEFREIFRLRKAHEQKFAFTDAADDSMVGQQNSNQVSTENEIKAFLGETRYHELQRSADSRFHDLYLLTQQFDLPPETAASLYDRHQQMQNEITRIQRDPSLNFEQKDEALRRFQGQLEIILRQSLGSEAYAQFQTRSIETYLGN
jgi:hypothetical protein